MGAKHDKVQKKRGNGQTEGKKLQQYSCIDYCINNYGLLAALDSFVQYWVGL
jgi:hypothetical protein